MSNDTGVQKTYIVEYRYVHSGTTSTTHVTGWSEWEAQAKAMVQLNFDPNHPVIVINVKPN